MPEVEIARKLLPILTAKQRFIVLIGGRGSMKSETVGRLLIHRAQTERADVLCGREYQNSIEDSVHKLLKDLIEDTMGINGFRITDNKIDAVTGGGFRFRGFARNSDGVKSFQGFKYSWIEEAQSLSKKSIKDLTPTIRAEGSQLFFTANPQSSEDPFSKRFINPYLSQLKSDGYYEDDMHLIIMVNWKDNPWFPVELEQERQWDFDNMDRAEYDHVWDGAFNDSVEDALIKAEWFDACIDAHKKLGFEPRGFMMAAHDPSDEGSDSKGFAFRHGSIVLDIQEKMDGDVNVGGDWATGLAINHGCDAYTWDCDGMGVGLNRQTTKAFDGKPVKLAQFKGSEGVDNPDKVYEPAQGAPIKDQKTNKQVFKNKRAQYYFELRNRILRTYKAVKKKEYHDPDTMISFCSEIALLQKLRSEVCRLPIKPNMNGMLQLYTKEEMRGPRFKIPSPNLADSVMMLMRQPHKVAKQHRRPPAIGVIGKK